MWLVVPDVRTVGRLNSQALIATAKKYTSLAAV
jgi:hypothetical protein